MWSQFMMRFEETFVGILRIEEMSGVWREKGVEWKLLLIHWVKMASYGWNYGRGRSECIGWDCF